MIFFNETSYVSNIIVLLSCDAENNYKHCVPTDLPFEPDRTENLLFISSAVIG